MVYTINQGIKNAIEKNIHLSGLKAEPIYQVSYGSLLFRVVITSKCDDFPKGCLMITVSDSEYDSEREMIGQWIDFEYGGYEECAEHLENTIDNYIEYIENQNAKKEDTDESNK